MSTMPNASRDDLGGAKPPSGLRRRAPLAFAAAAIGLATVAVGVTASPHLSLTEVAAQPKAVGVAAPNYLSPELTESVIAQGSWVVKMVASPRRAAPSFRAASRSTTMTAWAVGSLVSWTRSWARTTIASPTTATAALGRSPRSIADRASANASSIKSS